MLSKFAVTVGKVIRGSTWNVRSANHYSSIVARHSIPNLIQLQLVSQFAPAPFIPTSVPTPIPTPIPTPAKEAPKDASISKEKSKETPKEDPKANPSTPKDANASKGESNFTKIVSFVSLLISSVTATVVYYSRQETVNETVEVVAAKILEYLNKCEFIPVEIPEINAGTFVNINWENKFKEILGEKDLYAVWGDSATGKTTQTQRLLMDKSVSETARIYFSLRDADTKINFEKIIANSLQIEAPGEDVVDSLKAAVRTFSAENNKKVIIVVDDFHSRVDENGKSPAWISEFVHDMSNLCVAGAARVIFLSSQEKGASYISSLTGMSTRCTKEIYPSLSLSELKSQLVENINQGKAQAADVDKIVDNFGTQLNDIDKAFGLVKSGYKLDDAIDIRIANSLSKVEESIFGSADMAVAFQLLSKLPDPFDSTSPLAFTTELFPKVANFSDEQKKQVMCQLIEANVLTLVGLRVRWKSRTNKTAFDINHDSLFKESIKK